MATRIVILLVFCASVRISHLGAQTWNPAVYRSIDGSQRKIIFSDDFSAKNSNWQSEYNSGGFTPWVKLTNREEQSENWNKFDFSGFENDNYLGLFGEVAIDGKAINANNYEIETTFWGYTRSGHLECFWKQKNGTRFSFKVNQDYLELSSLNPGRSLYKTNNLDPFNKDSPNKLTVRKVDGELFVLVNEKLVHRSKIPDSPGMKVGFSTGHGSRLLVDELVVSSLHPPINLRIRKYITEQTELWSQRGDFEKSEDYKERMARFTSKELEEKYRKEAINLFINHEVDWAEVTSQYDPDSEIFELKVDQRYVTFVKVPISRAPQFGDNLRSLKFSQPQFELKKNGDAVLKKVKVTLDGIGYDGFESRQKAATAQSLPDDRTPQAVRIPVAAKSYDNRYALVIGNANYKESPLKKSG